MTTRHKPCVQPMTFIWWKRLPSYRFYILHEGMAIPAAWFSTKLIFGPFALKNGPEAWVGSVDFLQNPVIVIINLVTPAAALPHTKTWSELALKVANIIVRDEKMGSEPIIRSLWAVTVIATIVTLLVALYW